VNNKIHKCNKDDYLNWGKLYVPPKQTCVCMTHSVYAKSENGCVFAKMKLQSIITTALQKS